MSSAKEPINHPTTQKESVKSTRENVERCLVVYIQLESVAMSLPLVQNLRCEFSLSQLTRAN